MPVDATTDLTAFVNGAVDAANRAQQRAEAGCTAVLPDCNVALFAGSAVSLLGVAVKHLANLGKALGRKADNQTLAVDELSAKVDSLSANVATLLTLVRKLEASAPASIAQPSGVPRPDFGGNAPRGNAYQPGPDRLPHRVDRPSPPGQR